MVLFFSYSCHPFALYDESVSFVCLRFIQNPLYVYVFLNFKHLTCMWQQWLQWRLINCINTNLTIYVLHYTYIVLLVSLSSEKWSFGYWLLLKFNLKSSIFKNTIQIIHQSQIEKMIRNTNRTVSKSMKLPLVLPAE